MNSFTDKFMSDEKNHKFMKDAMMGPNAMRVSEELASYLQIDEGMRILDLGCGMGLSTLFLVQKYLANVVAADLWISPTDNFERFRAFAIDDYVFPVSVDVTKGLPFAHDYFDILFTIDSYHYYGCNEEMLPALIPFVKKGGYIAISIPGLKYEFGDNVPEEMKTWWNEPEVARTIRSIDYWRDLWENTDGIEIETIREMDCCKQSWDEWLTGNIPEAAEDIPMMEAEGGKYFNLVQLTARVL